MGWQWTCFTISAVTFLVIAPRWSRWSRWSRWRTRGRRFLCHLAEHWHLRRKLRRWQQTARRSDLQPLGHNASCPCYRNPHFHMIEERP